MHEDKKGYLWFTTDRGIVKYDGYNFRVYTTSDGLTNNANFRICEDKKGGLLFTSLDGGLNYYSGDKFIELPLNRTIARSYKGHLTNIYCDSNNSLYFFHTQGFYPNIYHRCTQFDSAVTSHKITRHGKSEIIAFESGQKIMMSANGTIHTETVLVGDRYYGFPFEGKELWVTDERLENTSVHKLNTIVNSIFSDGNDLWVCTRNGLFFYEDGNLSAKPEIYFDDTNISGITRDRDGCYWVTTSHEGIIMVPNFRIGTYFTGTSNNKIQKLAPGSDALAFGVQGGSVYLLNKALQLQRLSDGNYYFKNIFWASNDHLFAGWEIFERQGRKGRFSSQRKSTRSLDIILSNGDTVYGTYMGSEIKRKGEYIFEFPNAQTGKQHTWLEDREHRVWVGTDKGLWYSNYAPYAFNKYDAGSVLSNTRVNYLYASPSQRWLCAATIGKGVVLFDPASRAFAQVTEQDGLASNFVNSVCFVNDSVLWVATNKGLGLLKLDLRQQTPKAAQIRTYTTDDGLISNYINDVKLWNGQLWVATDKGLNYFDPQLLEHMGAAPQIHIDRLYAYDSSYYDIDKRLQLKQGQNDIAIFFTGISRVKPVDRPFYRCRVLKGDPAEVYADCTYTNNRSFSLFNLPPGDYIFEVQAGNKNGRWSETASLHFFIPPHFTQTSWFRILVILAIVLMITFAVNRRIRYVKNKQQVARLIQKTELQAKTAELNALRSQMNPHFMNNTLNSIQNFIFKKDFEQANIYITSLATLMRDGLRYSRTGFITLSEEKAFLTNYLELEQMRFGGRFTYTLTIDDGLAKQDPYIPSLLIQPLVENAIKHAFRHMAGEGKIDIIISSYGPDMVRVCVRDNGIGVKYTGKGTAESTGLQNIRQRLMLLHDQQQEHAQLVLTDLSLHNDKGTLAEMFLPVFEKL